MYEVYQSLYTSKKETKSYISHLAPSDEANDVHSKNFKRLRNELLSFPLLGTSVD